MDIPTGYPWKERILASSTVFIGNRSQAVRLPKAVAFPEEVHQVDIKNRPQPRDRSSRQQVGGSFLNAPRAGSDFMVERERQAAEMGESF